MTEKKISFKKAAIKIGNYISVGTKILFLYLCLINHFHLREGLEEKKWVLPQYSTF
jgi:hypothetical protein